MASGRPLGACAGLTSANKVNREDARAIRRIETSMVGSPGDVEQYQNASFGVRPYLHLGSDFTCSFCRPGPKRANWGQTPVWNWGQTQWSLTLIHGEGNLAS